MFGGLRWGGQSSGMLEKRRGAHCDKTPTFEKLVIRCNLKLNSEACDLDVVTDGSKDVLTHV